MQFSAESIYWCPWFAWHPIVTMDDKWIWLETVLRRPDDNWCGAYLYLACQRREQMGRE